jgi:hypothetical protein
MSGTRQKTLGEQLSQTLVAEGRGEGRDWAGFVIDRASADVQNLRLARNREVVRSVDHRFALSKPALVSAPSKKLSAALRASCGIETGSR